MSFKKSIKKTPSISGCYEEGLRAMGSYSTKVQATNNSLLCGSVDLDACIKKANPHSSRWDYIVGYNEKAYFVEVHPASSSEVSTVLLKVNWLRNWLKHEGAAISAIHHDGKNFHWIPTNGVDIRGKGQFLLAQNKIVVVNRLRLS